MGVTEPSPTRSPLYRLIEKSLEEPLEDFVAERLPVLGWRKIAEEIHSQSGVFVSYNTLRSWFRDELRVARRAERVA